MVRWQSGSRLDQSKIRKHLVFEGYESNAHPIADTNLSSPLANETAQHARAFVEVDEDGRIRNLRFPLRTVERNRDMRERPHRPLATYRAPFEIAAAAARAVAAR